MGFGNLILTQTVKILTEQHEKCKNSEVKGILATELREIKREHEGICKKMFSYELKGIEDWKKYLRGKFFEEENTIGLWFRMVCFMNGKNASTANLNSKSMSDLIKTILY